MLTSISRYLDDLFDIGHTYYVRYIIQNFSEIMHFFTLMSLLELDCFIINSTDSSNIYDITLE